jgi:hypothetical protein
MRAKVTQQDDVKPNKLIATRCDTDTAMFRQAEEGRMSRRSHMVRSRKLAWTGHQANPEGCNRRQTWQAEIGKMHEISMKN